MFHCSLTMFPSTSILVMFCLLQFVFQGLGKLWKFFHHLKFNLIWIIEYILLFHCFLFALIHVLNSLFNKLISLVNCL